MRRMLDIYSGLGGASEAFRLGGWEVHRLENNVLLKHVPDTQIVDVLQWPFHDIPVGYYDFIWASPPCTEFSDGYSSPKQNHIALTGTSGLLFLGLANII